MMSILTGLILVVVLGAIVQKSDTLMDAFSDFTSDETEEAAADPDATPTEGEPAPGAEESVAVEKDVADQSAEAVTEPPGGGGAAAPRIAAAVPAELAGYEASVDDVTVAAGGTYSIDVLGNDAGVRPATYGGLKILSSPECGIARLYEGRIAYFADELCVGPQRIFYCVEGAAEPQCERGVLTIHVTQPGAAGLDPASVRNDVSPGAGALFLPDRSPMVDISIPAPVVGDEPSAMPTAKSPLELQTGLPAPRAADGFGDNGKVLSAAAPTAGLFAGTTAEDAPPPVANEAVGQPNEVALLDGETEAAPLASPRRAGPGQGLALSPLPVAKPALTDYATPDAPQVAGAQGLQSLAEADANAPSGGGISTRVTMRDVSKAELLARRSNDGSPPDTRSAVVAGLSAPDAGGDAPEIAALTAAEIGDASALTLKQTDYASVASLSREDTGPAVTVNRVARLQGAPRDATPSPDRTPENLDAIAVEKGAGGAGGFLLRDRATVADQAEAVQPLTSFLQSLSSAPPEGMSQQPGNVRFEDPIENGGKVSAEGRIATGAGRMDLASRGAFTLRDRPAKAIPRESLMVESGGASSETPKIAPVEIAALNRDDPEGLRSGGASAAGELRRGRAAAEDCGVELEAVGARGALIRAEAASPCRAGQVVRFIHAGLEFAARFDAAGVAELLLPALDRNAVVLVRTEDAAEAYARATAPGIGRVSRVALVWRDDVDLNLHAFEYGAGPGANGHVWEGADQDLTNFKRGRAGLLQAFAPIDGYGDNVEVYSFAPGLRSTAGSVEIAVEFASRGAAPASPYCGGGALAAPRFALLRLENGRLSAPTETAFAAVACGAALAESDRYVHGLAAEIVVGR